LAPAARAVTSAVGGLGDHRPGSVAEPVLPACSCIPAITGAECLRHGPQAKALVTRLLAEASFELCELAYALVALHSADVMLAWPLREVEGVEDAATIVAYADSGGMRRLPYDDRLRINRCGSPRRAPGRNGLTRQNADAS